MLRLFYNNFFSAINREHAVCKFILKGKLHSLFGEVNPSSNSEDSDVVFKVAFIELRVSVDSSYFKFDVRVKFALVTHVPFTDSDLQNICIQTEKKLRLNIKKNYCSDILFIILFQIFTV